MHTPGPWKATRFDDGDVYIDGPYYRPAICKILPHNKHGERYEETEISSENIANTNLIAAPDLLEACKSLISIIENGDYYNDKVIATAKAAIAKVEGKP